MSTKILPKNKKGPQRVQEIEKSLDEVFALISQKVKESKNLAKRAGVDPSSVTRLKKTTSFDIVYRILYALNDGPPSLIVSEDQKIKDVLKIIQTLLSPKD